jgi:tetratricopeptide (TPR) repeat protein
MRTTSLISSGYAALYRGNLAEAQQCFAQVLDPRITPNFILHWRWRLHAQLGITEARLQASDIAAAQREADSLLQSALSTADPGMRALAWEIKSRVASAGRDRAGAPAYIGNALAILDQFDIPVSAWRVHATAWDLYRDEGDYEKANRHRALAQQLIMRVADSFEPEEPLRESFLTAPPIRRIFGRSTTA